MNSKPENSENASELGQGWAEKKPSLEERLKLVDSLMGFFKGGPSMEDELLKERRSDKW
jgi:hypothetical protein